MPADRCVAITHPTPFFVSDPDTIARLFVWDGARALPLETQHPCDTPHPCDATDVVFGTQHRLEPVAVRGRVRGYSFDWLLIDDGVVRARARWRRRRRLELMDELTLVALAERGRPRERARAREILLGRC